MGMSETTPALPALTSTEDTFALCVIEYGGNLGAAYRAAFGDNVSNPAAKARELLLRPEVAKRVMKLTEAVQESALISLGSHLTKLAEIRDLGITTGQLKVALSAERNRGEVAGFYQQAAKQGQKNPVNPSVTINIGSSPVSVKEWANSHGSSPVVIDV